MATTLKPLDQQVIVITGASSGIGLGMMAKINTFVSKNLPGIGDRMTAKQVKNLQRDEPNQDREGTLYIPGESGQTHGHHPDA